MSETTGPSTAASGTTAFDTVHEAYAFACMRCAHCWEQSYDIEHHIDAQGRTVVAYRTEGRAVPSPLTRPTCEHCGGHLVRIMQAGAVASLAARTGQWPRKEAARRKGAARQGDGAEVRTAAAAPAGPPQGAGATAEGTATAADGAEDGAAAGRHHWHLPALLRSLHPHRR